MSKNMLARVAVAVVAIPAILWICYQGGNWLKGFVILASFLAYQEFLYSEKISPKKILFWWASLFLLLFVFNNLTITIGESYSHDFIVIESGAIIFLLVTGMFIAIGKDSPVVLFRKYIRLVWGTLYIGLLYPFVNHVGNINLWFPKIEGGDWLLFLFAILWIGDSAALFVGRAIGKHKLAPSVSPNKTIEGFVGGLLGAIVVGVIMYFWKFHSITWYHVLIIAFGCSIFGQLGDLVESMWKRSLNIKDSSNIIPGHGGVLDRFDSLLFAAPFMYFYINLISRY